MELGQSRVNVRGRYGEKIEWVVKEYYKNYNLSRFRLYRMWFFRGASVGEEKYTVGTALKAF